MQFLSGTCYQRYFFTVHIVYVCICIVSISAVDKLEFSAVNMGWTWKNVNALAGQLIAGMHYSEDPKKGGDIFFDLVTKSSIVRSE